MNSRNQLAVNLRALRRERGLTQKELAFASGLNRSLIARYEQGDTTLNGDCVAAIAYALGVSVDALRDEALPLDRDVLGEFGQTLKFLRKERGLTQKELAEAVGVTIGTISAYECGTSYPKRRNLAALAAHFGVSASALLPQEHIMPVYEDELALVARYRSADLEGRRALLEAAKALGAAEPAGEPAAAEPAGEPAAAEPEPEPTPTPSPAPAPAE